MNLTPPPFRIGNIEVQQVVEMQLLLFAPDKFLPDSTAEAIAQMAPRFAPPLEANQAQLVDTDFALDDEVWLTPTPGHTPGHVAVHLKSAGVEATWWAMQSIRRCSALCRGGPRSPIPIPHWRQTPEWRCLNNVRRSGV